MIREAELNDVDRIREIEVAAGRIFAEIGMESVAADEPLSPDEIASYIRDARAWVSVDDHGLPIGYLLVDIVDAGAHVEQVSVDPVHAHRRLGRALMERATAWAQGRGLARLTLTTFADVPWNAPYYQRCGFRRMSPESLTPGLRAIRSRETAHGLDTWPRVCMERLLTEGDLDEV